MSYKKRLFCILWMAGFAGILSFLFLDLSAVIAAIPVAPGETRVELPPPALLKLVSMIQPTVILTLAVLAGVGLAERIGLHAPAAEAAARGDAVFAALKPQIVPGVLAGLAAGVALVITWLVAKPFFSAEFITRAEDFNKILPHIVRFLYGGFTEELLLRWGVMTSLAWGAWRLLQRGQGLPQAIYFIGATLASAILFGVGHLPIASMLNGGLTLPIAIYVVTGNSIFGVSQGFFTGKRASKQR